MGVFANNAITDNGRILLADVQAGAVFTPTRIVMGSGSLPSGTTAQSLTNVVTEVKSLLINKKRRTPDGKCIFGGAYSNADVTEAFYFRELALYAKAVYLNADGSVKSEGTEVLYSYGNAGNAADLMPAYSTSTVVEKQIDLVTWVGNTAQVDLTIESGLYVAVTEKGAPYGVAELDESANVIVGELGSVGSNSNMTVLAHRTEKGGLARYISVSKENDIKNSVFLTEELEGGGAVSHGILHTGMTDIPETIGANSNFEFLSDINLLEWALKQSVGGTFFTGFDVTGVPYSGFWHGVLTMGAAKGDKGLLVFNGSDVYMITTMASVFTNSEWFHFAGVNYAVSKSGDTMTGNLILDVPTNHGFRIKNQHTGSATDFVAGSGYSVMRHMDIFDEVANYRELMLIGTNGSPSAGDCLRIFDVVNGVAAHYTILHTGNWQQLIGLVPATVE